MVLVQIILGVVSFIIFIIYLFWKASNIKDMKKMPITANMPKVENVARRQFTDGYAFGILKRIIPRKNGCSLVEFFADDIEQGEGIPRPPVQPLIVKNEYIKPFARSKLSSRREVIKLIGRSPTDYPEEMRDTTEGKWMTKEGQLAFLKSTFQPMIKQGDEALASAMKMYARGEITKQAIASLQADVNRIKKMIQPIVSTESVEGKKTD